MIDMLNPTHVSSREVQKKVEETRFKLKVERVMADLPKRSKPNCRDCYGRGYVALREGVPILCRCVKLD
jgi:hypothetical protein